MKKSAYFILLAGLGLLTACATSAKISHQEAAKPIEVSAEDESRPIQFKKIVIDIDRGKDIGSIDAGIACIPSQELTYRGGKTSLDSDELAEVMYDEMTKANYEVVDDTDELFETASGSRAEYLVAGLVTHMQANVCYPYAGFGNWSSSKGEGEMKVEWQIFSRLDRKVVYKTETTGTGVVASTIPDAFSEIFLTAFANATRGLLANSEFHQLVTTQHQFEVEADPSTPIVTFVGASQSETVISADPNKVRRNVVTIFAGGGHGSGFFIDASGHLLTNEHVVGEAEFVKVQLATGREILGEVLAKNSRRDVALVQTERIGVPGLPIRETDLPIGSEVYALGSPLEPTLDLTITRGIVSAYRFEDGMSWIQSDVNILPGNSGGPLVDVNGNVTGISTKGYVYRGSFAGLNFFVPIREALRVLNLQPRSSQTISLAN